MKISIIPLRAGAVHTGPECELREHSKTASFVFESIFHGDDTIRHSLTIFCTSSYLTTLRSDENELTCGNYYAFTVMR